jgi:hypothetical protein
MLWAADRPTRCRRSPQSAVKLLEVAKCLDLNVYAPSATLGREARHFIDDFNKVRSAVAL